METLPSFAVVPILVGPLQVLLTLLPALLVSLGGALLALFKPATFKQSVRVLWRLKLPLVIFAGLIFGGLWLARAVWPKPSASQLEVGAADWPAFRGNSQRTGVAAGGPPPLQGGLNWAFKQEVKTFFSSPAIVGNRVYITSADKGIFADHGAIYCLDAETGAVVWKCAPDGFRATFSSPAVAGRYLVCGEGLHFTRDGRVVCLDITRQGQLLWQYRTHSHVESSPCLDQGRAYIGAGDDGYYCFDLVPGEGGEPKLVWHAPGDKYPDAETSPVAQDGKVYAGLGLKGQAVVCFEAGSGRELWRVPTPYPVFAPPTLAGGKVLVGMGNGNFIETAEQVAVKELQKLRQQGKTEAELAEAEKRLRAAGEVWAINLAGANTVAWRFKVPDTVLGAVAAAGDRLYFGSRDGRLYCLSPEGKELGQWNARAPILTSPAVTEGYVYFVTETGRLQALDRLTMQLVWETAIGTEGPFLSSPAVGRGHVYVGTQQDGLLSLGGPKEAQGGLDWPGYRGGPGKSGARDTTPLPERGALLWRWPKPAEEGAETKPPRIAGPAALAGDLLCVPIAAGPKRGVVGLKYDPKSRQAPAEQWFYETTNGVSLSPAIVAWPIPRQGRAKTVSQTSADVALPPPQVFVVDGKPGDSDRHLHCLNARNGAVQWRVGIASEVSGEFVIHNGSIFIQDTNPCLVSLDLSGRCQWRTELGQLCQTPAAQEAILVAAIKSPPALVALDQASGRLLWRVAAAPATGPVVERNCIYLGLSNGLAAYRLLDGQSLWAITGDTPACPLVLDNGLVGWVTTAGEVVLAEVQTGQLTARFPGAVAGLPPLLTRDAVLFAGQDGLMMGSLAPAKTQRWMATGWLGPVASPLILADSSVYFATEAKGLIRAGKWK